jgi:hypothetical protein
MEKQLKAVAREQTDEEESYVTGSKYKVPT